MHVKGAKKITFRKNLFHLNMFGREAENHHCEARKEEAVPNAWFYILNLIGMIG